MVALRCDRPSLRANAGESRRDVCTSLELVCRTEMGWLPGVRGTRCYRSYGAALAHGQSSIRGLSGDHLSPSVVALFRRLRRRIGRVGGEQARVRAAHAAVAPPGCRRSAGRGCPAGPLRRVRPAPRRGPEPARTLIRRETAGTRNPVPAGGAGCAVDVVPVNKRCRSGPRVAGLVRGRRGRLRVQGRRRKLSARRTLLAEVHQWVRDTLEMIVGAVTGAPHRPRTLLLGRHDFDGRLQYAGARAPCREFRLRSWGVSCAR